ncbi:MAG: CCA tRNA nucleotidyltransferase [Fibrobacter sp.]|nr:CCA tRNA nucleotidyltransferase [Fibrobacter sp.]
MAMVTTLEGEQFEPELPSRLLKIAEDIEQAGGRAYLVGGWVRDALLAKNCRDYDVEVYDLEQDELLPILSKYGKPNLVGKAFGVIHLAMKGESLDFSFPRTESKVGYGHKGFLVKTDARLSFKEAALRRDFTINAMGMQLPSLRLCDPYNGVEDLKQKCLRHVGAAFAEDSLRILRGVQFASRFDLTLAPETVEMCRTLSLDDLSVERIFEEFKKWLLKPGVPSKGLAAFVAIGLHEYFEEIKPIDGSWQKLGELLDAVSQMGFQVDFQEDGLTEEQRMVLMFSALLLGNPSEAESFLLRITNETVLLREVPKLLAKADTFDPSKDVATDEQIRRLSVSLNGLKLYVPLLRHNPSFERASRESFAASLLERAVRLGVYKKAPEPYLMGKMLIDLGVKPGKQMGEIIKASFELQLKGEIQDKEQAIAWAKGCLK